MRCDILILKKASKKFLRLTNERVKRAYKKGNIEDYYWETVDTKEEIDDQYLDGLIAGITASNLFHKT